VIPTGQGLNIHRYPVSDRMIYFFEVLSKPQITSKDKARVDEKAQSRQRRDERAFRRNSQRRIWALDEVLKPLLFFGI